MLQNHNFLALRTKVTGSISAFFANVLPDASIKSSCDSSIISWITNPAFARALIADPPVLILDEATSSIDPYSELLIQQALETLMKGRTSISIAHRLSTIINSDRIIVLDKGQIIEQGSHQELVEIDGFYNHIYRMQFKDPFKKEKRDEMP